jgi:hypothetical protein
VFKTRRFKTQTDLTDLTDLGLKPKQTRQGRKPSQNDKEQGAERGYTSATAGAAAGAAAGEVLPVAW